MPYRQRVTPIIELVNGRWTVDPNGLRIIEFVEGSASSSNVPR